ncbi:MAG: hypothetical protein ACK5MQ_12240, partial [Pikeienuella sp.]
QNRFLCPFLPAIVCLKMSILDHGHYRRPSPNISAATTDGYDTAEQTASAMQNMLPDTPAVLIRINFRMLVVSLERHGVRDMSAACDLAQRYFLAGEAMTQNPISNRWRQILINRSMTENEKYRYLSALLNAAEKGYI